MRELKKELWPFKICITHRSEDDDIAQWLNDTIGGIGGRWNVIYGWGSLDYYFRKGEDATMFTLRWL